jgi:hypothetical protein
LGADINFKNMSAVKRLGVSVFGAEHGVWSVVCNVGMEMEHVFGLLLNGNDCWEDCP